MTVGKYIMIIEHYSYILKKRVCSKSLLFHKLSEIILDFCNAINGNSLLGRIGQRLYYIRYNFMKT